MPKYFDTTMMTNEWYTFTIFNLLWWDDANYPTFWVIGIFSKLLLMPHDILLHSNLMWLDILLQIVAFSFWDCLKISHFTFFFCENPTTLLLCLKCSCTMLKWFFVVFFGFKCDTTVPLKWNKKNCKKSEKMLIIFI